MMDKENNYNKRLKKICSHMQIKMLHAHTHTHTYTPHIHTYRRYYKIVQVIFTKC